MKNLLKILPIFFLFVGIEALSSRLLLRITVVDRNGTPVSDIQVHVEDGASCLFGTSDTKGMVEFHVGSTPNVIYLSDTRSRPLYGISVYRPAPTRQAFTANYRIVIPRYPQTSDEVGRQLDAALNTLSTGYGYHSAADFINKGLKGGLSGKSAALGVPGVFSVNPIPQQDSQGRLVLGISGILAEKIMSHFHAIQSRVSGRPFIYQTDRGVSR